MIHQKTNHVKNLLNREKEQFEKILKTWPLNYQEEKKRAENSLEDIVAVLNEIDK